MAKLPEDKKNTRDLIFKAWEENNNELFRPHLGASLIGDKCERHLYYVFRWSTKKSFPGRILKLFDRGHSEEDRFVSDLKSIGCDVLEVDQDGLQWNFEMFGGHFGGSADGIIRSGVPEAPKSPHIAEFKTHSEKSFKSLVKDGVEKSKPIHYAQMMIYMGLSAVKWGAKFRIERALYLAVNKNNDDLYSERIRYNKKEYDALVSKAERIIFTDNAPDGISSNPSWYECKFCNDYDLCHNKKFPEVNCRTCAFSSPHKDGNWQCELKMKNLNFDDQNAGCDKHLFNPSLVNTWMIAIDADDHSISFENKETGEVIVNGKGGLSSKQLKELN